MNISHHFIRFDSDVMLLIVLLPCNYHHFSFSASVLKAKEVKDEGESKGGVVENKEGCKVSIELYHSHLNNIFSA